MLEHQLASENKFGQVDFRSHLPEWQVEILTKVTPCIGTCLSPRFTLSLSLDSPPSARVLYQTSSHSYNQNYHRTAPLVEVWAWSDCAVGKPGALAAGSDFCSDCCFLLVLQEEVL